MVSPAILPSGRLFFLLWHPFKMSPQGSVSLPLSINDACAGIRAGDTMRPGGSRYRWNALFGSRLASLVSFPECSGLLRPEKTRHGIHACGEEDPALWASSQAAHKSMRWDSQTCCAWQSVVGRRLLLHPQSNMICPDWRLPNGAQ